jgi:hypothetical protein
MKANGGFPPIKIGKSKDHKEDKKEKKNNINLKIRNILSESKVKPMIELDKPKIDIIDNL